MKARYLFLGMVIGWITAILLIWLLGWGGARIAWAQSSFFPGPIPSKTETILCEFCGKKVVRLLENRWNGIVLTDSHEGVIFPEYYDYAKEVEGFWLCPECAKDYDLYIKFKMGETRDKIRAWIHDVLYYQRQQYKERYEKQAELELQAEIWEKERELRRLKGEVIKDESNPYIGKLHELKYGPLESTISFGSGCTSALRWVR